MPTDPLTSRELPDSAIQRLLYITPTAHIYSIPPLASSFSASSWTAPPRPTAQHIFTARIRILETSIDNTIRTDILLEDPSTGELFAGAPYTTPAVVQQANDSSRFFAIRVQGEGGMKATLGLGFEERGAALDFNIALSECRKVLGLEKAMEEQKGGRKKLEVEEKTDFSLKDGEKIHIQVGSKGGRRQVANPSTNVGKDENAALFSIAPPPGPALKAQDSVPSIATPSAVDGKKNAQDFGFDDGEFGEFQ
jgi:adaptin ear-binding coat-associated protein 1/2